MKVNDSNLSSLASTGTSGTQETARTGQSSRSGSNQTPASSAPLSSSSDDVHLSELVKNLRSLAADSPERQAKLESLARSYASGSYTVDANATASGIIDDSLNS
jgi:flagellar biosynthesis anti-sigma factor FlgM